MKFGRLEDTHSLLALTCSALIKMAPGNRDIYFAHTSWFTYKSMLRIQKMYKFPWHTAAQSNLRVARSRSELGDTLSADQQQSLWQEIATTLNSMGPATKHAAGYRRFWNDLVAQFKGNAGVVSDATPATAANPPDQCLCCGIAR
ncbi:hypothetical protein HPB52_017569 [Rhipicephalus sanguineus]|uniref:Phospholipase B-like n=1 Tax=Rhipicephalus sanguineus TaxID=34632 RepID=A0A9D4Q1D5_RHISA|nr:hypothetical protein HPB52_017569 [Rhipicephalus sanguineus]